LARVVPDKAAFLEFMEQTGAVERLPAYVEAALRTAGRTQDEQEVEAVSKLLQLIYLDAMGYARRCKKKTLPDLFPKVFDRYVATITSFREAATTLDLRFGTARFQTASAFALPLADASVDGVLTSPPYSFAIDYAKNDQAQLEFLGHDVKELRNEMIGLRGGNKPDRIKQYFVDLRAAVSEMYRVLKPGKMCVIIIGSNDIQTKGIRHEVEVKKAATEVGFELRKEMVKPIKGMRNSMREEFILFFHKPSSNNVLSKNNTKQAI
jgi:SAM-dependent methyltransferase